MSKNVRISKYPHLFFAEELTKYQLNFPINKTNDKKVGERKNFSVVS